MAQVSGDCKLNNCPLQSPKEAVVISKELETRLAKAYAFQSQSDFRVYRALLQSADLLEIEECHRLHYLQMACEKIAKAYRLRDTISFSEEDLYSHVVFSGFIQTLLKAPQIKDRFRANDAKRRHLERYARSFAREIEKLAPAVDRTQTPANVEYPWVEEQVVLIPCQFSFASLSKLKDADGREFLKLIEIAITDYETIRLSG